MFVILLTLALNSIWAIGVTHAKIVDVGIECSGPGYALRVYPDTVVVSPGDTVRWSISVTCRSACSFTAWRWEIVIPPCPPLFPAGFSGGAGIPNQVISPAVAGCPGICKYTVKLYGLIPEFPCAGLDPYIQCVGGGAVPTLTEWGMIILVALLVFSTWVALRRRKVIGVR
jgi:hypothetical protein